MADLDRDKFYAARSDDWDDDVEYEVEPPDSEVIALEKRRVEELVKDASMSIDVDELYRAWERPPDPAVPFKLPKSYRFQFQVKHLLIATAVLAVFLTLWRLQILANVAGVFVLAAIGGALAYTEIKEQHRCQEAERMWREKNERVRRYFENKLHSQRPKRAGEATIYDDVPFQGEPLPAAEPIREKPFRIQFSLRWMLICITIAAIALGFVQVIGSSAIVAMILGAIACGGLALYTFGVRPPQAVVVGWWLVLVLYVLLGVVTEIRHAF